MFFPLSFVVVLSAIKDLLEDIKRHKEDRNENKKKTRKYTDGKFEETSWEDLHVGDVIKVKTYRYESIWPYYIH